MFIGGDLVGVAGRTRAYCLSFWGRGRCEGRTAGVTGAWSFLLPKKNRHSERPRCNVQATFHKLWQRGEPLLPCSTASQMPNLIFGTEKTAVQKKISNSSSMPTLCFDKAALAQCGGGVWWLFVSQQHTTQRPVVGHGKKDPQPQFLLPPPLIDDQGWQRASNDQELMCSHSWVHLSPCPLLLVRIVGSCHGVQKTCGWLLTGCLLAPCMCKERERETET